MLTQKDIARELNISRSLVSHALNNRSGVNEETRNRVLERAGKLNYRNNIFASAMRSKTSKFICNIYCKGKTQIETPADLFQRQINAQGYHCMNICIDPEDNNESLLDLLYSRFFAGVIVNQNNPEITISGEKISKLIKKSGIPCVIYGSGINHSKNDTPAVIIDVELGYKNITELLIKNGAKKIIFIGRDSFTSNKKFKAVEETCTLHGIIPKHSKSFIHKLNTPVPFEFGREVAQHVNLSEIDAAICANDIYALGFVNGAVKRGAKIPEQIKVVGCDNMKFSNFSIVQISSIDLYSAEFVEKVVGTLFDAIAHKDIPPIQLVVPEIIERESSSSK